MHMAGVFKSLDKSDIRIVPFRTHKQWVNDLNYTITPTPSILLGSGSYNLKHAQTNFSQSVNAKNNYYYLQGYFGELFLVDGQDDYAVLAQTSIVPSIEPFFLNSVGPNQNYLTYVDTVTGAATMLSSQDLSVIHDGLSIDPVNYKHLAWLPGSNMLLVSANDNSGSPAGLTGIVWNTSASKYETKIALNPVPNLNYLGTTFAVRSGSSSNYFAAFVDQSAPTALNIGYFNHSGSILRGAFVDSLTFQPKPVRDFVSNGGFNFPSAFLTIEDYSGIWFARISSSSEVECQRFDVDVVRLLQDKDLYRNGYYGEARTFAVLKDGTILLDLYADSRGYGWEDIIDARRWVGGGQVIAATINKNIDILSSTEPLTITIYSAALQGGKGPITAFSVDLETQEISDPIHLGYHNTESSAPFLGDDGTVSINFVAENTEKKVVGFMYEANIINANTGNLYSQIYTINPSFEPIQRSLVDDATLYSAFNYVLDDYF